MKKIAIACILFFGLLQNQLCKGDIFGIGDACMECECLNGHRFYFLGDGRNLIPNNHKCQDLCEKHFGIEANWNKRPTTPGLTYPWTPLWGDTCPVFRTFTNKTPHIVLIQFLNIASGHKNADGSYTIDAKIVVSADGSVHGLDDHAPIMILPPNKFQRINYSHADMLLIVLVIHDPAICKSIDPAGCAKGCKACAVTNMSYVASDLIMNTLNFDVVFKNNTVSLEASASQKPLVNIISQDKK